MKRKEYLFYFLLFVYLLYDTPLVSDDFSLILEIQSHNINDLLIPSGFFVNVPIDHYIKYIWYYFFSIDNLLIANTLKVLHLFISFYLISKFFSIYLNRQHALMLSFLFIFYPTHDSTAYMYLAQYLPITIALYMFAYYLAHEEKLASAFLMSMIASFTSYASLAIAFSLTVLFMLSKKFKKAAIMIIPNIFYIIYYIFVTKMINPSIKKQVPEKIDILVITKQLILQVFTFIDSMLGPSMWLKLYYSYSQLSFFSLLSGGVLTVYFYRLCHGNNVRYDFKLLVSFFVLVIVSFGLFAITGYYPQMAFNIGNRTTIFGALLFAYLLFLLPISKHFKTFVFALIVYAILGISDHWKSWNNHQMDIIYNIQKNENLQNYNEDKVLYVSGNQYSKYGPFSHIEFFSEHWVVGPVFSFALKTGIHTLPINKRHYYNKGFLVDKKYKGKTEVIDYINVYDSEKDVLLKVNAIDINRYIDSLPPEYRHWIMLNDNKLISVIKRVVLFLMPRLGYAL